MLPNWNFLMRHAGMVAQLTDHEGSVFIGFLSCLGSGNGREAANFALMFSKENEALMSDDAKRAFADDMELMFHECCRGYGTNVDVGEVLRGVLGTSVDQIPCLWSCPDFVPRQLNVVLNHVCGTKA